MAKPKIVLSRCFLQPVRYNGGIVSDDFVDKLKNHVDIIDLCPEFDIGLGVPRPRLIVIEINNSKRLFQPETERDLTERLLEYADKVSENLKDIDGFILKSKSPSCGVSSTKLYVNNSIVGKTDGLFAEAMKRKFPHLPIEDEGRLRDGGIREHFLTRIFIFAELREFLKAPTPRGLVEFHSRYKYLLMAYSQKNLKELGQLVADGKMPFNEKIDRYSVKFYQSFNRRPNRKQTLNVLNHMFGHISRDINQKERNHLIDLFEKYRKGLIGLEVIVELLKSFAYRFENQYLLYQKFLEPYPIELNV